MSDPAKAMHKAIRDALVASNDLKTAMGGTWNVYDSVPAEPTYPFVRIGEDQPLGNDNGCFEGWEYFHTLHLFARPAPPLGAMPTAKGMAGPIKAALVALEGTTQTGIRIDEVEWEGGRFYTEADGITAHGVLTCRFLLTLGA